MAVLVHGHIYGLVGLMTRAAAFGFSRHEPSPTTVPRPTLPDGELQRIVLVVRDASAECRPFTVEHTTKPCNVAV